MRAGSNRLVLDMRPEPSAPVSVRDGAKGRSDPSGTGSLNQRPPRSASRPSGGTVVPVPPDQPHQTTGSARLRETSARPGQRPPQPRRALAFRSAWTHRSTGHRCVRAGETRVAFPGPAQRGKPCPRTGKSFPAGRRPDCCGSSPLTFGQGDGVRQSPDLTCGKSAARYEEAAVPA